MSKGISKVLIGLGVALLVIFLVAAMLVGWVVGKYNSMVSKRNAVDTQWSQVEVKLQLRYDKIPQLVEAVKGAMKYEGSVLEEVTRLRSQWGEAGSLQEKAALEGDFSAAVSRLLLLQETYPELKANQNVVTLMDEVSEAENMIGQERRKYNDQVYEYNTYIQTFPNNFFASTFGFEAKPLYQSTPGAEEAPKINGSDFYP